MKKKITLFIASFFLLSCFSMVPAAAQTEKYPPFETGYSDEFNIYQKPVIRGKRDFLDFPSQTLPLDEETRVRIAEDYKKSFGSPGNPKDYHVLYFKTLSNGLMMVFVEPTNMAYTSVNGSTVIGKYIYTRATDSKTVMLYQNGSFSEIWESYANGDIDDGLLEEINSVMKFDRFADLNEKAEDLKAASATPDSADRKPSSTPDSGTSDNSYSSGNPNAAVPTGERSMMALACVVLLFAAAGCFFSLQMNKR